VNQPEKRHYTEEELLLHALGEEEPETGDAIQSHFKSCQECRSVFQEYHQVVAGIQAWKVPELSEESWDSRKRGMMLLYRQDLQKGRRRGISGLLQQGFIRAWEYALANPLPTMAYVIAAVAFASERTIATFRLDRVLPATAEVFKIIRQVL
jgi:hypothetical protein